MATVDTFRQQLHDIYEYGVNTGDLIVISKQRFEDLMADFDEALDYNRNDHFASDENDNDDDESIDFNDWSKSDQAASDEDDGENDTAENVNHAFGLDDDQQDFSDDEFEAPQGDVDNDADQPNYGQNFKWDGTRSNTPVENDDDQQGATQSNAQEPSDSEFDFASAQPQPSDNGDEDLDLPMDSGSDVDGDQSENEVDDIDEGSLADLPANEDDFDEDDDIDDDRPVNSYNAGADAEQHIQSGLESLNTSSVNSQTSSDDILDMLSAQPSSQNGDIQISSSHNDVTPQSQQSQVPLGSGDVNTSNGSSDLF